VLYAVDSYVASSDEGPTPIEEVRYQF